MKYYKYLAFTAILIIFADQLSKWWLVGVMQTADFAPIMVTSFFNLAMVWNRGVSFGILSQIDARIPLIIMSFLVAGGVIFWHRKSCNSKIACGVGMIVGGAIGNVIDRLHYGAVADFFDFHYAGHHWPSFNLADMCILSGVCLLILCELKSKSINQ